MSRRDIRAADASRCHYYAIGGDRHYAERDDLHYATDAGHNILIHTGAKATMAADAASRH